MNIFWVSNRDGDRATDQMESPFLSVPFVHFMKGFLHLKIPHLTNNSFHLKECISPDNISGFGEVYDLAAYLVSLCGQEKPLDNGQADNILTLSNADPRVTVFTPFFSNSSPWGRFKASKSTVALGVEATQQ